MGSGRGFTKRVFDRRSLGRSLRALVRGAPGFVAIPFRRRVASDWRERLMLAVTGVNDCRYCRAVHSRWARAVDVPAGEIDGLLAGEIAPTIPEAQHFAIAFARHYAETEQQPDPARLRELRETYGDDRAEELIRYLDAIFFANVSGNTFDAFLRRLRGQRGEGGSWAVEVLVGLVAAPILAPQLLWVDPDR